MKYVALLMILVVGPTPIAAQTTFDLQFDHSTILVSDLEASASFYERILHLKALDTPWGPTAPIRFFSLGGDRQLHVGISERDIDPDKNAHLAFAVRDFDAFLQFLRDQGIAYSNFPGPQQRAADPTGWGKADLSSGSGRNWIEINDASHFP